jgi:hypothetical protein
MIVLAILILSVALVLDTLALVISVSFHLVRELRER